MLENDYSILVAKKILSHFPDFSNYITYDIRDGENQINIEIPSPNDGWPGMSIFASESEEIILFYSGWHCHFEASAEDADKMLQQISGILNEKLSIVNYLCFGQHPINDGVFQTILIDSEKLPFKNTEYFYATEMEHISWHGTLNRKFYAPYIKT